MSYYKIMGDGKVLDVNDVFLRWQKRHGIAVICEPNRGEFICPRDGSAIYHPSWLHDPPEGAVYDGEVDALEISEYEYRQLLEQLNSGDSPVETPDPGGDDEEAGDGEETPKPTVADLKELTETCADLKAQVRMLTECVLEMSEEVYA